MDTSNNASSCVQTSQDGEGRERQGGRELSQALEKEAEEQGEEG